jgi:hypothetical protein
MHMHIYISVMSYEPVTNHNSSGPEMVDNTKLHYFDLEIIVSKQMHTFQDLFLIAPKNIFLSPCLLPLHCNLIF